MAREASANEFTATVFDLLDGEADRFVRLVRGSFHPPHILHTVERRKFDRGGKYVGDFGEEIDGRNLRSRLEELVEDEGSGGSDSVLSVLLPYPPPGTELREVSLNASPAEVAVGPQIAGCFRSG